MVAALAWDRCVFGNVFAWGFRDCAFDGKGTLGKRKSGADIGCVGDAFGSLREHGCAAHQVCDTTREVFAARVRVSACDVCGQLSVLGRDGMESREYLSDIMCVVGKSAPWFVCGKEEA